MSKSTDWFPNSRENIIRMARTWGTQFDLNGPAWDIPAGEITIFKTRTTQLDALFQQHKNNEERTPVGTQQLNAAFNDMEKSMRNFYRLYILNRRSDIERVALDLRPIDHNKTPLGPPTAQVTLEIFLRGRHELGIRIVYLVGSPDDKENKGYRIWYKAADHGETPPASPEGLTKSFYTKRKKDVIPFEYNDSGKTAFMAVQVENDGKKGPWGPMINAVIP
jgi:hypothetical protein